MNFMDQTFCMVGGMCQNRETCHRYLSPELEERASELMEYISFSDFSLSCDKYEPEEGVYVR
jgi:hypothetical protein